MQALLFTSLHTQGSRGLMRVTWVPNELRRDSINEPDTSPTDVHSQSTATPPELNHGSAHSSHNVGSRQEERLWERTSR